MNQQHRLAFLDALRAFAILGVIIAHCGAIGGLRGALRHLTDLGGFGVQLFFIVSAFTIFLTYTQAISTERFPRGNFFVRRLMRIVPIYWLGIILYSLTYGLGSRGWDPAPALWHYPFHLTLTNIFLPSGASSVVPGGWSISVEVMFYITTPLWISLIKNMRAAVAFVVLTSIYVMIFPLPFFGELPLFGMGMVFFFAHRDVASRSLLATPAISICLCSMAVAIFGLRFCDILTTPPHLTYGVVFLLGGLVLMNRPIRMIVNPATIQLGKISYSLYLLHFLVIQQLVRWLPLAGLSPVSRLICLALFGIMATVPLAYLAHRYIERATYGVAKGIVARREQRAHGYAVPQSL